MTRPAVDTVAGELYAALGPITDPDETHEYAALHLCAAVTAPVEQIAGWARDTDDEQKGWTLLLDVERCPDEALGYLGQFVGVTVPDGVDGPSRRALVRTKAGAARGTQQALIDAAKPTLTGNRTVLVLERTTSAYTFTVVTRTSETPDAAKTLAALKAVKPAGLVLTHVVSDAPIIDEGTLTIDAVAGGVTIDNATVGGI
jgi:hypothetical protein